MTRILSAALVIAALVVLTAGCLGGVKPKPTKNGASRDATGTAGPKRDKSGNKAFADPEGLFTVKAPKDWFVNGTSSLAVEMSPMRSNANLRSERDMSVPSFEILAGRARKGDDDLDFAARVEKMVRALVTAKPAALRGPVKAIEIAGGPGAWASVEMSTKTGEQIKMFLAVGGDATRRVQMMGYSPPDDWDRNVKTFQSIAESFRFTGKKKT